MRRFVLIGGKFDGAWKLTGRWPTPPERLWVRDDPDSKGPFGLLVCPSPHRGGERYILSELTGEAATYLHETIRTGSPARRLETVG